MARTREKLTRPLSGRAFREMPPEERDVVVRLPEGAWVRGHVGEAPVYCGRIVHHEVHVRHERRSKTAGGYRKRPVVVLMVALSPAGRVTPVSVRDILLGRSRLERREEPRL